MLEQNKRQKCYGKRGIVVRKNGKVFRNRVCVVCGIDHWHGDNMCVACRNTEHRKRYGYHYLKRKETPFENDRQRRLAEHTKRVRREITSDAHLDETIKHSAFEMGAV